MIVYNRNYNIIRILEMHTIYQDITEKLNLRILAYYVIRMLKKITTEFETLVNS